MTIVQFLALLKSRGINLWVENDRLGFEAPKGALTPDLKAQVVARKQELIDFLKQAERRVVDPKDRISTAPADAVLVPSFAQERLWFIQQLDPTNTAFLIAEGVRITESLETEVLERVFRFMIDRHDALRTAFVQEKGEPRLAVAPSLDWSLPVVDLTHLSPEEREREAARLAAAFAEAPFDLAKAPLFRLQLLRLAPAEAILLICMHHIITDGWSMGIFNGEWPLLYRAFAEGSASPLPALPVNYADVAWWQRKNTGVDLSAQIDYWVKRLAGVETVDFPTDRPRPARQTYPGDNHGFAIDETLTAGLRRLAEQRSASMYMLLLTGFQTLLHRYSGQTDITVGSSIGNRDRAETEGLMGLFVNLLTMRNDYSGNPSFLDQLARVRDNTLAAFEHGDAPFEKIVDACKVPRDLSRHPLFQIQLVFMSTPKGAAGQAPLQTEPYAWNNGVVSRQDLTLTFKEHDGRIWGGFEYNTDLFNKATIARLTDHLLVLLETVVRAPQTRLADLPLMTPHERDQLRLWNQTTRPFPAEQTLHGLFEAQAAQQPGTAALVKGDTTLTYGELNAAANRLAHHLLDFGVEPEAPVGVCLAPGFDLITALLAILKAGATYVPLDPGYPGERLSFLMTDTGMNLLISNGDLIDNLPAQELNFLNPILLDEDADMLDMASEDNPNAPAGDLAYVVYTSGTTGGPKGVMVSHRNVLRLVYDTDYLHAEPGDGIAQSSNISFDAMTFEVWTALLTGARLCLVDKETYINPEAFAQEIRDRDINLLFTTTALFNQFARTQPQMFAGLKYVCFGGEQVDPTAVRAILEQGPPQHLRHVYGPTESTTFATWHPLDTVPADAHNLPIGLPITNTTMFVLDPHFQETPVGVVGEIFLGGDGLARGYLNRPELSAEKFVPNPFTAAERPGERLYRTGDLARRLPNGAIEFYGRRDFQVKVRGFRIELEEIEVVLLRHPGVDGAVAMVRTDDPDQPSLKRLVAYVRTNGEPAEDFTDELRHYLKTALPDYMIPAALVVLETFPVTPNGKIDRRQLPKPDGGLQLGKAEYVAPRNDAETRMAAVWAAVLGRDQVGIHDNYFDLGGDSLLSIQVKARAAEECLFFELQQLFEYPTIARLMEDLDLAARQTARQATAPFSLISERDKARLPAGIVDAYPTARLQEGMLFHAEMERESATYHDVIYYRLALPSEEVALRNALDGLSQRHDILRTSFDLAGFETPMQLVHETAHIPLTTIDLRDDAARETTLTAWIEQEKQQTFDWRQAPLMRVFVHRLTDTTFQLTFSFHHAVLDGWSEASLFSEFLTDYQAQLNGKKTAALTAPDTRYRDFIALEQATLNNPDALQFWTDHLANHTRVSLPQSIEDTPSESGQGRFAVALEEGVGERMKGLVQELGVPLKTLLLAAHLKAVSVITGHRDTVTGLISNGRPETLDGDRVIGLFLNTPPFRFRPQSGSWKDLVTAVYQQEKAMLPHRRFPLPDIMTLSGGQALFDTAFNYTHFHAYDQIEADAAQTVLERGGFAKASIPLLVHFNQTAGQLTVVLEYDSARFGESRINAFAGIYAEVLSALSNTPQVPHNARAFGADDAAQLRAWNQTAAPLSKHQGIHHLVEATAASQPNAVAVHHGDQTLTHDDLNRRANRLAAYLMTKGVGAGHAVGICMDRNPDLLIAMLAVLKTGAAYVPLDPAYPEERRRFMLEDAAVALVLSDQPDFQAPAEVVNPNAAVDDTWSEKSPAAVFDPRATAYIIYTSGSTGRPKGVVIPHSAATAMLSWAREQFSPEETAGVLAATSVCFDLSIFEIFLPLTMGGAVVLVENALGLTAEMPVTLVNTVPSAMTELLNLNRLPQTVTVANLAGEPLRGALTDRLYQLPHIQKVYNLYGPSEDTTYSTFSLVPRQRRAEPDIGRPIANTRAHILNQELHPVPILCSGQLYLAGAGLASGYHNRPALTAQAFVPDPFAEDHPGSRLYATGDLARFLPDGRIEFLGRADHQVKLRGFRIELGEIERRLLAAPGVREALVLDTLPGMDGQSLTAWVVLDPASQDGPDTSDDLRTFVGQTLPAYMVPNQVLVLDRFPLTPNGKIDRRNLPLPQSVAHLADTADVIPNTPTEDVIAGIWSRALSRDRVGVTADFFELGGQSLTATRIVAQIGAAFDVDLSLRALFEYPTVRALAAHVDQLLHQARGITHAPITTLPPDSAPVLSFAQERMWFLDQLEPGSAVYNMPHAVRLQGDLNPDLVFKSFAAVQARHETLYTRFPAVDGRPQLQFEPQSELWYQYTDLTDLPAAEREFACRKAVAEAVARPFDLVNDALLRVYLYQLDTHDFVLLLNMHHIVADGWSLKVLSAEFAAVYEALRTGATHALDPLPIQYKDFAHWQRNHFSADALTSQLDWWRTHLADAPAQSEFPADHTRPGIQTITGREHTFQMPNALAAKLHRLMREEGVTPFMTLLAGFGVLFQRYAGQADMLFGTPIANRNHVGIEHLIGVFVNTLVLRLDLSDAPSFRDLLKRVRRTCLDAYANQDAPFEQVVDLVQPQRDMSRSPLFQIMFSVDEAVAGADHAVEVLPGLNALEWPQERSMSKFDLSLSLLYGPDRLEGLFEYNADLYDGATMAQIATHFRILLEALTDQPDAPVARVDMLGREEHRRIVHHWNDEAAQSWDCQTNYAALFEQVAAEQPQHIALIDGEQDTSYAELNRRANQLARYLVDQGVGPESLVGVCQERGTDLIVAFLAVLKAGGAYLPLDPYYPESRLNFILENARPTLLLTRTGLLPFQPKAARVLDPAELQAQIKTYPEDNPARTIAPQNLAYVIYTSGSTGNPKGVGITHQTMINHNRAIMKNYSLTPADRVLQFCSISFDQSVEEIFPTLLTGAALVLHHHRHGLSASDLVDLIQQRHISVMHLPTAFWHEWVVGMETGGLLVPGSLRCLEVGGEKAQPAMFARWSRLTHANVTWFNTYGPTEATVTTSLFPVGPTPVDPHLLDILPIGKPLTNYRLYVLDPYLNPVPVGLTGELFIGGPVLARGYLGRFDETAVKFIPDPFAEGEAAMTGARLYRTGDAVRYLPDGHLEFMGRTDFQVKIRGFRIEPDEIARVLMTHPHVDDAVVGVTDQGAAGKRLIAHAACGDHQPTPAELRQFLLEKVPDYMIPTGIAVLQTLPLTGAGKVDRTALTVPEDLVISGAAEFVAPQTPTQTTLAAIWSELLERSPIGIHDNFFELGGHSLLVARVVSRLKEALGVNLPIKALFEYPTIAELAAYIDVALRASAEPTDDNDDDAFEEEGEI